MHMGGVKGLLLSTCDELGGGSTAMVRLVMFCVHTNKYCRSIGRLQKHRNTKFEVHLILHSKDITQIWDVKIRMYERMYDMYASHVEQ